MNDSNHCVHVWNQESQAAADIIPEKSIRPVVPYNWPSIYFKQIKCKNENCAIETFCSIQMSAWICPIHENLS